jgi:DNA sulfur modification protein DndD
MIIQKLIIENFGVYGGRHELDLAPRADGAFARPVILMHGKNGVGKTSFVEALRIVLHGKLALGTKVGQAEYYEHLKKRIHRPSNGLRPRPDGASLTLVLSYVRGGHAHEYTVTRKWMAKENGVKEVLTLLEDGVAPPDLHEEQIDPFLRELIPSSAGDLFFFDGERIEQLTADGDATVVLADSIKRLLGLHLVDQLDTDLDRYIKREVGQLEESGVRQNFEVAEAERQDAADQLTHIEASLEENKENISELVEKIALFEEKLANEGGEFAKRYDALREREKTLRSDLELSERRLQDACGELLPFAAAPTLAGKVLKRLELESLADRWKAAQELIMLQQEAVEALFADPAFWGNIGIKAKTSVREELGARIFEALREPTENHTVEECDLFLHASEKDRGVLSEWIERALTYVGPSFNRTAEHIRSLQRELAEIAKQRELAPNDEMLLPILSALKAANTELEELRRKAVELEQEHATTSLRKSIAENRIKRLKDDLRSEQRVEMAVLAQRAFRRYAEELQRAKLVEFEKALSRRFNELARKESLVDRVTIDSDTFAITLHRGTDTFGREELSAGEKQIFAIATVWALREVSRLPMPVVIDTPLGRLDSDHRQAMLQTFFPHVSHQVILLATDTEIDGAAYDSLVPAISHGYAMGFDTHKGTTHVEIFDSIALSGGSSSQDTVSRPAAVEVDEMIDLPILEAQP